MKCVSVTDHADQEWPRTLKTYPVLACRHTSLCTRILVCIYKSLDLTPLVSKFYGTSPSSHPSVPPNIQQSGGCDSDRGSWAHRWDTPQTEHRALPLHWAFSIYTCFSSEGGRAFHYNLARHPWCCTGQCVHCGLLLSHSDHTKVQGLNSSLTILTPEAWGRWSAPGGKICSSKLKEYLKENEEQCTEI